MINSQLKDKINTLKNIFSRDEKRNVFKKYIEYIRFPYFKNFKRDFKVSFDFPITFIVGQNGSGKSSFLQALYGSPKGYSLGDYWYSTSLDPIEYGENRNSLIYSYITDYTKQQVEVIKRRIKRSGNPEYWEPSEPIIGYGMQKPQNYDDREVSKSKDRWNQLEKKVYYLDFRYSLSAYDKYFHFSPLKKTKNLKKKQDFIRKYSSLLQKAIKKDKKIKYYKRTIEKPILLSNEQINEINSILGKRYDKIIILKHNIYTGDEKDYTIKFYTQFESEYSEAYAGSGETAIVRLVYELSQVDDYSLVLLDEPETSLHPAAQKGLLLFLLKQIIRKKLQVIISTHSPDLIENMPKESIKIFYENPSINKIDVIENVYPENAFSFIGRNITDKKVIIVEDKLAKMIVEGVLKSLGEEEFFEVKFFPGGENRLKQEFMSVYSKEEDNKHYILFDGDQRTEKIDISQLSDNEKNVDNLRGLVGRITNGQEITFAVDGNSGRGNDEQKIELMLKYIKYHFNNVFYLPKNIPEEIIWDDELVENSDFSDEEKNKIHSEKNYKNKFALYAEFDFGSSEAKDIESVHKKFLKRWLGKRNEDFEEIKSILIRIKEVGSE